MEIIYKDNQEDKGYSGSGMYTGIDIPEPALKTLADLTFSASNQYDLSSIAKGIVYDTNFYAQWLKEDKNVVGIDSFRKEKYSEQILFQNFWSTPPTYNDAKFVSETPGSDGYFDPVKLVLIIIARMFANSVVTYADFNGGKIDIFNTITSYPMLTFNITAHIVLDELAFAEIDTTNHIYSFSGALSVYVSDDITVNLVPLYSTFNCQLQESQNPQVLCYYGYEPSLPLSWSGLPERTEIILQEPTAVTCTQTCGMFTVAPSGAGTAGKACFDDIVDFIQQEQMFTNFNLLKWLYSHWRFTNDI